MNTITKPVFHDDWFSQNIPQWEKYLGHLKGRDNVKAIEIGCWEGRSTCWMLENILTAEDSSIICIDTFQGNPENYVRGYEKDVKSIFISNIEAIGASRKMNLIPCRSSMAAKTLHEDEFDLIYIDGSHDQKDVLIDLCHMWPLLKSGGVMIMDDYEYNIPAMNIITKLAIDSFYRIFAKEIIVLHQGWQMIWRKS